MTCARPTSGGRGGVEEDRLAESAPELVGDSGDTPDDDADEWRA
jgi:hypothetical protein